VQKSTKMLEQVSCLTAHQRLTSGTSPYENLLLHPFLEKYEHLK